MIIDNYRSIKYIGALFEVGLTIDRGLLRLNDNVRLSLLIGKDLFKYGFICFLSFTLFSFSSSFIPEIKEKCLKYLSKVVKINGS